MSDVPQRRFQAGDDRHGEAKREDHDEQPLVPGLLLALYRPAHALAHQLRDRGER